MAYGIDSTQMVSVDKVFLDTHNPRHDPVESEPNAIAALCQREQVITLAEDIAEHGLNPLELFALVPEEGSDTYFVAEGNRRLCAILLLNDPQRAPSDLQKRFSRASEKWTPVKEIFSVIFDNREEVRLWLDRIHAGPDEGRGRRSWGPEQKARNTGYSKNDYAQSVLDIAQDRGWITATEREGRISTVQKYLANPVLRNSVGLKSTNPLDITSDMSDEDFSKTFKRFVRDVAERKIDTRTGRKADDIRAYASDIDKTPGLSGKREAVRSLTLTGGTESAQSQPKDKASPRPNRPKPRIKAPHDKELYLSIKGIPSHKLEHLYYSLTSIQFGNHTPLLYVAAWSLIESIARACGAKTDFQAFLSNNKLGELGFTENKASIRSALRRISELGNSTKHDATAGGFDGQQLANDLEVLTPVLIALIKSHKALAG